MDGDIAKYAMWLFRQTDATRETLPSLYDYLCQKNPLRSEVLSFQAFEELFQRWRWQAVANTDSDGDTQSVTGNSKERITFVDTPDARVVARSEPEYSPVSSEANPAVDYHVVTEMLIEQLIKTVKRYLAEGWTPLGGITRAGSASSASYWAQAMVKNQFN